MSSPELAVRQLARLPSNCTCPNCGTWSRYGFSSVCMKYLTFVCDKCKPSHQAISHRCKSLTMSSWDHGEALKLKVHGNDYARKVWLATAPPPGVGGRPREGDDIDVFKRFVVDAYENRRYYRDPSSSDGGHRTTDVTGAAENVIDAAPTRTRSSVSSTAPAINTAPVHTPVAVAPVVVDLLDFGAFETPAPPQASVVTTSSDAFFDPFNNDSASMVADVSSQSTSTAAAMLNNLTSSSSNNNKGCNNISNQLNNITSFDAFAPSTMGTVMSNNASSMQSNNHNSDPFSGLATTPAKCTNTWGMMPMNPSSMSNFSTSINSMNGGTPNFANNNMMTTTTTMNGGGGMMNNSNAMMINGNYNMMNISKSMMMNGDVNNNMMHNGGANATMMMMMSNGGCVMPSNMVMHSSVQQQFYPHQPQQSIIMNSHTGSPMLNTIPTSNNFSAKSAGDTNVAAASAHSNASNKPDPFAGLMGL